MKVRVLVYDNQAGYYELLKKNIKKGFSFLRYDNAEGKVGAQDNDLLLFFMNDMLELPDYIRLYSRDIPVILAYTNKTIRPGSIPHHDKHENVHYINLGQHKNEIMSYLKDILNKAWKNLHKQERKKPA